MEDVSNRMIAVLLVLALAITVVGTFFSVSRLGALGGRYAGVSGMATDTGTTSINIQGTSAITVTDNSVNFSSGYFNTSCTDRDHVNLTSDGLPFYGCWLNTSGMIPYPFNDNHTVVNTGTSYISVNVTFQYANAEMFFCGSSCSLTDSSFVAVKASANETGACTVGLNTTYENIATYNSNRNHLLCGRLDAAASSNDMLVSFKLGVPKDATHGSHSATITYIGESV
jgi:hypothetical protein